MIKGYIVVFEDSNKAGDYKGRKSFFNKSTFIKRWNPKKFQAGKTYNENELMFKEFMDYAAGLYGF